MNASSQTVTLSQALQIALQHFQEGRFSETENICTQILHAIPENADALHLMGLTALRAGRLDIALELVGKAIAILPDNPYLHNSLGEVYSGMAMLDQAIASYREAIRLFPEFAEAHNNLGIVYGKLERYDEAIACYRKALSVRPEYPVALNNMGNVLRDMGKLGEACGSFRQAILLDPEFAVAEFNLSLSLLYLGDYRAGFALYEKRFEGGKRDYPVSYELYSRFIAKPRWDGASLHGKRLLIWTEQGMGDTLMMLRFFPQLEEKEAGRVIVYCEPEMMSIMRAMPVVDEIIPREQFPPFDSFDVQCPIMSLPHLLGVTVDTLPNSVPYLSVPSGMDSRWVERLASVTGLKVGLVWAAGKRDNRDVHLRDLAPLVETPGVTFFSLQKGRAAAQLAETGWPVHDWMDECGDFLDTASLIEHLDLVISVDTSVAHLAGALGKPVWLLNRFESEWRWMQDREDTPWYPTMRLFQQPNMHDWAGVVARMCAALACLSTEPERCGVDGRAEHHDRRARAKR